MFAHTMISFCVIAHFNVLLLLHKIGTKSISLKTIRVIVSLNNAARISITISTFFVNHWRI